MSKSKRSTPNDSIKTPKAADRPDAALLDPRGSDTLADLDAAGLEEADSFALAEPVAGHDDTYLEEGPDDGPFDTADNNDVTPSWFGNTINAEDSERLADHYRTTRAHAPMFEQPTPEAYEAYRRRLEERFQSAKRIVSGPVPAFSTMPQETAADRRSSDDDGNLRFREWQKKMNARQTVRDDDDGRARLTPLRIASLFAVACSIGGIAGLASANMPLLRQSYDAVTGAASSGVAALMAGLPKQEVPPAQQASAAGGGGSTVLTKKPVRMARVDVADASGALNNPIPLALTAVPADPNMPLALKISGLPGDAYLTQGTEVADGEWLLKPAEIEGVKLVVPQAQSPQLDLAVAAVEEKTGVAATPPREMTVELDLGKVTVQPANAPPEVQGMASAPLPQAIPLPQEAESTEAKTLLGKGEALLKTGDLVSARQFFVKAHGMGLADGAYGAGQTYDPVVYSAMNVHGLEPDPDKAREWYDRAAADGHAGAAEALEKLNAALP